MSEQRRSATRYELHFHCCGNVVRLGTTPEVGMHDQHCLSCETEYPETEVKEA